MKWRFVNPILAVAGLWLFESFSSVTVERAVPDPPRVVVSRAALSPTITAVPRAAFTLDCPSPFADAEVTTAANDACGPFGAASDDPKSPHALQNATKNDLCANGKPAIVTFATFTKLQNAIVAKGLTNFTATKLPLDRSISAEMVTTSNGDTVGEGKVVSLVAFVLKAKRGGKESVNCNVTKGTDLLDFHIVLGKSAADDECDSVTAEAIPHFRPAAWTLAKIKEPGVPMRFTGQLFLDASHKPCRDGKGVPGNPARFTSWEIHPVYAIDVCKSKSVQTCKADDESIWTPLDKWEEETEEDDAGR